MSAQVGFQGASQTLKNDVNQMMTSGEYYVTPEVATRLQTIENAVDHIRLDNDLLRSSTDWRCRFDQPTLHAEKQGAMAALDKSTGTMFDLKNHINTRNVIKMQDNQVREVHEWATKNLNGMDNDIGPYAARSVERIRQFCDHMGVTDRYTGYRHNLNRGSRDPVRQGFKWLDDRTPNSLNRSLNVGWKPAPRPSAGFSRSQGVPPTYAASRPPIDAPATILSAPVGHTFTTRQSTGTVPSLNIKYSGSSMERGPQTAGIQEQCGINTGYPGQTEYMSRYPRPPTDQPTRPFTINPAPDFHIHGRPLMKHGFDPNSTEYQARYEWPDGSRITKLPWLRK